LLAKLYARLQRRALLRSPARARIHALVLARPGATLADLGDATGLGRGALVHHCQMLERHGLVASRHDGLRRRFYPPGERPLGEPRPPTPKEARVILLVRERGPLTQAEIAALLGVTRQAVHEQVRRLERDRRLVPRDADGERRWLAAEPEGAPAEAPRPLA
ncbi:MAG TPA: MarR family transcriptional regulator, partial [Candidatus Thermoplasmatota archaeon]|nr:MarR family transcriptional regulator [Candidatus Thermoplasmatota archaeon]